MQDLLICILDMAFPALPLSRTKEISLFQCIVEANQIKSIEFVTMLMILYLPIHPHYQLMEYVLNIELLNCQNLRHLPDYRLFCIGAKHFCYFYLSIVCMQDQ